VRRLIWPLALQVFARAHPCFEQSRLLQASTAESMARLLARNVGIITAATT
jgi:hypothetical protein